MWTYCKGCLVFEIKGMCCKYNKQLSIMWQRVKTNEVIQFKELVKHKCNFKLGFFQTREGGRRNPKYSMNFLCLKMFGMLGGSMEWRRGGCQTIQTSLTSHPPNPTCQRHQVSGRPVD